MSKKALLTAASIVAIFLIATLIYFINPFSNNDGLNKQDNLSIAQEQNKKEEKDPDTSKDPSEDIDEAKVYTIDEAQKENKEDSIRIKKEMDRPSIEGFTNEEIEEAGKFVSDYIHEAHANTYFLGGEWGKNGNDIETVKGVLGRFYSKEVIDELDKYKGNTQNQEFAEKVSGMIPFFDENENYSPSEFCAPSKNRDSGITKLTPEGGEIVDKIVNCPDGVDISEISYESVKAKNGDYVLNMYFNTSATYPLYSKELNKDAQTTAKYDYALALIRTSDEQGWEIASYSVDVTYSKIEELKE